MLARAALSIAAWTLLSSVPAFAQTFTSCNPRFATCPADTALGKSISVDFTKGAVDSFTASGNPTYDSSGAHFTVAKSGDSPTLISLFYIMFGKVSITMKCAPGAGIVSTLVLESDDLDEIDMEWLGADNSQVQTNYFGKGDTSTYDRGQFNPAPNNQNQFITYTIEWTADQVIWSVGGNVVRVLTPATSDANQYPQTPMQVKFGAWSGGDASNAAGTIQWAQGPTDYSKGPFTMTVQSIAVSDYSTGTSYKYSGSSGKWQDIVAVGGAVNGNKGSSASTVAVAQPPSATSASPSIPFGGSDSTKSGWPWVASATTLKTTAATSSVAGIPSGWTVSSSGKIVPISSAATSYPTSYSSPAPSPSPSSPPSSAPAGLETITTWDSRGFLTTMTVAAGYASSPKCWNDQGFQVACGVTSAPAPAAMTTAAVVSRQQSQVEGAFAASTTSGSPHQNSAVGRRLAMPVWCCVALGVALAVAALL